VPWAGRWEVGPVRASRWDATPSGADV